MNILHFRHWRIVLFVLLIGVIPIVFLGACGSSDGGSDGSAMNDGSDENDNVPPIHGEIQPQSNKIPHPNICYEAPAINTCTDPDYPNDCGDVCCPSTSKFYCPATGYCYRTEDELIAACGDDACYNCSNSSGCHVAPATNTCTDPDYPNDCGDVCCPSTSKFYCPATGYCYRTEDALIAACGDDACYTCNTDNDFSTDDIDFPTEVNGHTIRLEGDGGSVTELEFTTIFQGIPYGVMRAYDLNGNLLLESEIIYAYLLSAIEIQHDNEALISYSFGPNKEYDGKILLAYETATYGTYTRTEDGGMYGEITTTGSFEFE